MKNLFLFLLLLPMVLLFGNLGAAPLSATPFYHPLEERTLLQSGAEVTRQKFPDAAAVLVDDLEVTRVQPDGTSVTIDDYCYKILTDDGARELRTLSLGFSAVYEQPEVLKAQLFRADGTIVEIDPKSSSRISIDPEQMQMEIFDPNSRVLLLLFPELRPGDMIRVVFKVTAFKVRMPGTWCDITLFQSTHPVLHYTRIIEMPKTLPLRSTALKNVPAECVSASQTDGKDFIRYSWSAHDLPQIIPEPAMPSLPSCAARLLVSTIGSWEDISRWYAELCRPRLQNASPALKAKCRELVSGKKSEQEKIRALNDFVSRNVRYTGITAEAAAPGYEPHDVSLTFERGHGVCRDKAALLVAMLNEVGIPGRMVLIMAGDPKDAEVPNTYFNHAVVAVERKDHTYLLMDPTSENSTELFPAYLGNCSYLPAREQGETLRRSPVEPADKHTLRISTHLTLNAVDQITGETTIIPTGRMDQIYRSSFYCVPPERMHHFFSLMISRALPGSTVTSFKTEPVDLQDTGKPLKITIRYMAGDLLRDHASTQPIPLPRLAPIFGFADNFREKTLLPERKFPLKAAPRMIVEDFKVVLPEDVQCVAVPGEVKSEIPGVCRFRGALKNEGRSISGSTLWSLDSAEIRPEEYLKIQQQLKECSVWWNTPLLVRHVFSGATSRYSKYTQGDPYLVMLRDRKVQLTAPGEWTEQLHERRLLQKNGEGNLRFSYYEPLETLEISGFTVTGDGRKTALSPNEIKRMDAPWSADSTRYPGGKILTVSFPSAEVGAQIEYTLQRKVSGRPFFHAALSSQRKVATLARKLEISLPKKMKIRCSSEMLGFLIREKDEPNRRIFTVIADGFLRIPSEPGQPPASDFLPTISFSNGNYREYSIALNAALHRSTAQRGKGVKTLAAELVKEPEEKRFAALQQTVSRRIRLINAPLNRLALDNFADPESTLRVGEASSADRAVLIAALLEELKVDYRFVAFSSEPYSNRRVRMLNDFPEEIFTGILVYLPREKIYFNDTGEYARPGAVQHEGKIGIDLNSGHLKQIVPRRGYESSKRIDTRITFASAGSRAQIKVRCQYKGNAFEEGAQYFASLTPVLRKRFFQKKANQIFRGAEIVRTTADFNTYPGYWEMTVDVPEYGSLSGGYRSVALPLFGELISETPFAPEKRSTPYSHADPVKIQYSCDFNLPAGYEILCLRSAKTVLGHLGQAIYTEKYTSWKQGGSLSGSLEIPVHTFEPDEYHTLAEISHYLNQPDNKKIIFVRKKE